jgi:putative nucleotidyltransferase with HDIG domain
MKPITVYVGIVTALAVVILVGLDWGSAVGTVSADWTGFITLLFLGLLSETLIVRTAVGGAESNFSITFIPLLTGVLLFGPVAAVILFLVVGVAAEFVIRKKPVLKAAFNSSQYVISSFVGGIVYGRVAIGVEGFLDTPPAAIESGQITLVSGTLELWSVVLAVLAYGFVFLTLNHALVAGAIAISRKLRFRRIWSDLSGPAASNILLDLLVSPLALGVAFLYADLGAVGLFLVVFPILFVRHFYLINYRLTRTNQDLLRALVKAIETRDPYTSGHSMRVSSLSQRIARALGLNERKIAKVEQSALLHDVGKIDAIYTEILKKPDSLSSEERLIIESHVTKGVELLETLSSVPQSVIADVRHHHERIDGKGYPDGLRGDEIPLGARIIKVADAIDAMLSDRPYRKALSLEAVRYELLTYAGTQFDEWVVNAVVASTVLEEHATAIAVDQLEFTTDLLPSVASDRGGVGHADPVPAR